MNRRPKPPLKYWIADLLILTAVAILTFGWLLAIVSLLVRISRGVHL